MTQISAAKRREDFDEEAMVIVFHSRDDCAPLFRAAARIAVAAFL